MFGTKRATRKAVLIADVDDAGVGVAITRLAADAPAEIISAERMSLPIEERAPAQSIAAILQILEQCLDKALKAAREQPSDIHIIVRAPWTRFRTAHAEETLPAPRAVTKEMIPALAQKATATITDLDASNIFESGVMEVFLNGYPTGKPIGKEAQAIGVTVFGSDINAEVRKGVLDVFGKLLPGRVPTIHSGMRALLAVLHEHIPDIHRFVVLDMGGSATNCAVVRKEMLTQSAEAHEGSASIVRRIAGAGIPEETLTQLRMLAADTCSTEACMAVKDSLSRAEPDLAKVFGEMFTGLAQRRRLPNYAIVVAPYELLPWLQGFFSRIDFAQFTATTQPLEAEALLPSHLAESVAWKAASPPDVRLTIAAASVNISEHSA